MITVKKFSNTKFSNRPCHASKRNRDALGYLLSKFTDQCMIDLNDSDIVEDWRSSENFQDLLKFHFCIFDEKIPVGIFQFQNMYDWGRDKVMGFWIAPEHRSKGYAKNAVRFMVNKFENRNIKTGCWSHNIASKKVILDNGFIQDDSKYVETPYVKGTALYFTKYAK